VGRLGVPFGTPVILISDTTEVHEYAVRQLIRIGYDDLPGYLEGGMAAWRRAGLPVERTNLLTMREVRQQLERGEPLLVVDVRQATNGPAAAFPRRTSSKPGRSPMPTWNTCRTIARSRPTAATASAPPPGRRCSSSAVIGTWPSSVRASTTGGRLAATFNRVPRANPKLPRMSQAADRVRLGLGANWQQFTLLVVINAFVGGMVGLERACCRCSPSRTFC